ncbi:MAG: 2-oxo acid dehydrogenase subunit E2 [Chloroflexi bacterium]|nr:2-oxo acid dehydrogenase subunit E2 [Ardenticatenaceae bacterium]MBL1130501.1 2-oxo acid dehydrogenase subunit E2 [Chloroflexota bacterium]NOG36591.1 2-oxo acid dehydrogenase subunit E2 [Chloroflexota bacterium]
MAEFILMPTLGFDMEEGTMGSWLKNVGDPVHKGDVLAEIESDKVTQELQARAEGVLLAIFRETGDQVPVGAKLGIIGAAGEDISSMTAEASAKTGGRNGAADKPAPASEVAAPAPESEPAKTESGAPAASTAVSSEFPGGVKATPVARRVAEEHGVDLTRVGGTGPDGRIRKADVETFIAQPQPTATPATASTPAPAPVAAGPDSEEIPLTRMRSAIARRMTESKTTVPHFYVTTEIDMEPALALRKQINNALDPDNKVTVNDLIVKAAALALREFPNLNASFGGDKLIRHNRVHVGSAVAIEGGLLTVVQKDTDISSISKIARDHKEMFARAREGKVRPEDVEGATFTVSNLGPWDVENFVAIINPPHAGILAVGSARQAPVVVNGELAIGTRMKVTLSADHRVTDGAEAAQFMQAFKAILENALRLLL